MQVADVERFTLLIDPNAEAWTLLPSVCAQTTRHTLSIIQYTALLHLFLSTYPCVDLVSTCVCVQPPLFGWWWWWCDVCLPLALSTR